MEIQKDLQNAKLSQMESYITSIIDGVKMVSGEIKSAGAQKNLNLFKMTLVSNLASIRLLLVTITSIIAEIGDLQMIFEEEHNDVNVKQTMDQTATLNVQENTLMVAIDDISLSIKAAPPPEQAPVQNIPIQPSTKTSTEPREKPSNIISGKKTCALTFFRCNKVWRLKPKNLNKSKTTSTTQHI